MNSLNVISYNKNTSKNVNLRLIDTINGVDLICVDEEGDAIKNGRILAIGNNGKLHLYEKLNTELGFKLDDNGRIVE